MQDRPSVGHVFTKPELLEMALTHSSLVGELRQVAKTADELSDISQTAPMFSYERLEFLGDCVLDLIVSEYLYLAHIESSEGDLSRMRARIVCERSLAQAGSALGLGKMIAFGKTESTTGGETKPSILADVFEAVLGAIYLDAGLEAARAWVLNNLNMNAGAEISGPDGSDFKTALQELLQGQRVKRTPRYETLEVSGPAHAPEFQVGVFAADRLLATASANTRKKAEQRAAMEALIVYKREVGMENLL